MGALSTLTPYLVTYTRNGVIGSLYFGFYELDLNHQF